MNGRIDVLLPYTRISSMTRVRIKRILPEPGEILVQSGEPVEAVQKIARIPVRGEIQVVNVARILGLSDHDLSRVMVKKRGDRVKAGEIIAAQHQGLPFLHKPCRSPISGRLLATGHGMVVIESAVNPTGHLAAAGETGYVRALVTGQVAEIEERRSVTIETVATHIFGACGVGGEGIGTLQVLSRDPSHTLSADDIGMGSNRAILVGRAGVSLEAIERAREMQVSGIIVGGISSSLHDLAPAPSFPVVATEGYGSLAMSPTIFEILNHLEGHEASICGQMDEAWEGSRPEIIVPLSRQQIEEEDQLTREIQPTEAAQVGDAVRAVRNPLLGHLGQIASISLGPQPLPSGLSLTGAQVAFADSERPPSKKDPIPLLGENRRGPSDLYFVPWLNLERVG